MENHHFNKGGIMKAIKMELSKDKDCKHSIRYAVELENGQKFTVYVPKQLLNGTEPNDIILTIESK
jgi:hypothetical protein